MKTIISLLTAASLIALCTGCAAKATVGNQDQHGAAVDAKTKGPHKGVHAKVY